MLSGGYAPSTAETIFIARWLFPTQCRRSPHWCSNRHVHHIIHVSRCGHPSVPRRGEKHTRSVVGRYRQTFFMRYTPTTCPNFMGSDISLGNLDYGQSMPTRWPGYPLHPPTPGWLVVIKMNPWINSPIRPGLGETWDEDGPLWCCRVDVSACRASKLPWFLIHKSLL